MKSRLTTVSLVLGLSAFGAGGAYAGATSLGIVHGHSHAHHGKAPGHGKKHKRKHHRRHHKSLSSPGSSGGDESSRSSAVVQYGTRPGKGCGDRNHVHTGPPGNPSNTHCPPQSRHG